MCRRLLLKLCFELVVVVGREQPNYTIKSASIRVPLGRLGVEQCFSPAHGVVFWSWEQFAKTTVAYEALKGPQFTVQRSQT